HHRQRAHRRDQLADAVRQRIAARPAAGVYALHVERREPLVDEGRELRGQRRLLDVVFSLEEVHGIGVPGLNLLAEVGWSSCQNASRIAETMLLANSVLSRSSALASWPKYAEGSTAPVVCVPV